MDNIRTAFITFFPIKPDTMGSSAVVNSRFVNWPYKKRIFQISHVKRVNNKQIETIFINKENPLKKIMKLPEVIFRVNRYLKKSKTKIIIIEGASWIFYSFVILFFFKIFFSKKKIIYISHSIESEIRKKFSNIFIYQLTKFLENLVFKYADISTSVSTKEQRKINLYYNTKTILLPNGITIENFNKNKKISSDYLIYTGSYFYKPNKDAIDYLNNFIMPKLIIRYPKLKLILTGGGFDSKKYPWIINKGIVSKSNLYNLLFFSKGLCVPLKFGSGTRIKILEALCLGSIVISSKKGIEGIDLRSINPPYVINRDSEYINKIFEILKYNKKIKNKSIKNKKYYLKKYSMIEIIKKFVHENKI